MVYAKVSVETKDWAETSKMEIKWFMKEIRKLDKKLVEIEDAMYKNIRRFLM